MVMPFQGDDCTVTVYPGRRYALPWADMLRPLRGEELTSLACPFSLGVRLNQEAESDEEDLTSVTSKSNVAETIMQAEHSCPCF